MKNKMITLILLGALCAAGVFSNAQAAYELDLATDANNDNKPDTSEGVINGAIFLVPDIPNAGGTGNIKSFVRIQADDDEEGYNVDGTKQFDEKGGIHTHSLTLGAIEQSVVNIGGTDYYDFLLDIHQNQSGDDSRISMTELQIFISDTGDRGSSGTPLDYPSDMGTKVYDMDDGEDATVQLDSKYFSGSGVIDMFLLVPTANFSAYEPDDVNKYVVLYSHFGDDGSVSSDITLWPSNATFEEWAHVEGGTLTPSQPIPEPTTLALFASGLIGLSYGRRRRVGRQATPA